MAFSGNQLKDIYDTAKVTVPTNYTCPLLGKGHAPGLRLGPTSGWTFLLSVTNA